MNSKIRVTLYIAVVITFVTIEVGSIPVYNKFSDDPEQISSPQDTLSDLLAMLHLSAETSDVPLFKRHYNSIITVIEGDQSLSEYELSLLSQMFLTFTGTDVPWNASDTSSYRQRKRPLIISWISPTDGAVSLAWLVLPDNWDPEKEYPLYVTLHGLYDPYQNRIDYMTRYLKPEPVLQRSFSNGYAVFPWGRGNLWYEGIAETDIWECVDTIESIVKIDQARKYIMGHSMGGYGAWVIAHRSANVWAALGVYAGALWYNNNRYLNLPTAVNLKDLPTYIVCGEQDGLLTTNNSAYGLLSTAGNQNIKFVSYPGNHDALFEQWDGMYNWMKNFSREVQTDVDGNVEVIPSQLILNNNYPNPFNPETKISYYIPSLSYVELKVFDVLGREVETLVSKEQDAGYYEVTFNADKLSGGVYMYRITAGSNSITKKMDIVK